MQSPSSINDLNLFLQEEAWCTALSMYVLPSELHKSLHKVHIYQYITEFLAEELERIKVNRLS